VISHRLTLVQENSHQVTQPEVPHQDAASPPEKHSFSMVVEDINLEEGKEKEGNEDEQKEAHAEGSKNEPIC